MAAPYVELARVKPVFQLPACIAGLPRWCELALYGLLIWFGIGLVWFVLSPRSSLGNLTMPAAQAARKQDSVALRTWFETASAPDTNAAPVDGLQLLAVIAGRGGVALLGGIEASSVAVRAGMEFRPGSRLLEVLPDRVIVEQNGKRQELTLSASAPVGVTIGDAMRVPPPPPPNSPMGSTFAPTKLSRGQFSTVIQGGNLGSWDKGLASAPDGGILVENAEIQPLSKLMKLESGDVLLQINNRPLKQLADISLVFNAFSQQDAIDLMIVRHGTPQTLRYQVKP